MAGAGKPSLAVDFLGGAVGYRMRSGAGRSHALLKATGVSPRCSLHVIDATAGLGRDAFLLASFGATVTMIERAPAVHALLSEALDKARAESGKFEAIVARLTLIHGEARKLLPSMSADVIMVDPMHPPRTKTALVKQEMRLLRDLVGTDPDVGDLMQAALAADCSRVVLKWPLRAAALPGLREPSHRIAGKTVRYDVFVRTRSDTTQVAAAAISP
jgi:16S rRNA (guanine1516-N2)-methyltransferase